MESYKGNFKSRNEKGGFLIGTVDGNCEIYSGGGPLTFKKIAGNLLAETVTGDIDVGEVGGTARLITQSGDICISSCTKGLYAETGLGEIVIQSANDVEAKNIYGGDVKIFDLHGYARIDAVGNIMLIVNNMFSGGQLCDLSSKEGDIILYLPEDFSASLEIKTPVLTDPSRETRIESNFPFTQFKQRYQEGKILVISTQIKTGKVKLSLYIEKGNVHIYKKARESAKKAALKENKK